MKYILVILTLAVFASACSTQVPIQADTSDAVSGSCPVGSADCLDDPSRYPPEGGMPDGLSLGKTGDTDIITLRVEGKNYRFFVDGVESPTLRVKEGDRVRIEFMSASGFHDFVIDEFGAKTEQLRDGGTDTIEFVADKKGTFEYYCSVGNHRGMGMKGSFIVE